MSLSVKNQKNSLLKSIKSNNKLDIIKTASLPMRLPDLHKGMNTQALGSARFIHSGGNTAHDFSLFRRPKGKKPGLPDNIVPG